MSDRYSVRSLDFSANGDVEVALHYLGVFMNFFSDSLTTFQGIVLHRSFLNRSQFAADDLVKDYQAHKLKALLLHCFREIPYYSSAFREYGVDPRGDDPFVELKKLPILTKAEVRNNHSLFIKAKSAEKLIRLQTSGTTGEPMVAYTSRSQWVMEQGCIWRQWKWAGYRFRDRIAIFRSYARNPDQPKIKIDRLKNWAYFSVFDMDDGSLGEYVEFLQGWRPSFLRGYPSSIQLLSEYVIRKNIEIAGIKAVFVASEVCTDTLRDRVREAFGASVFDHYGQAEITAMFHDCEVHEGMHVDWEYGYCELIPAEEQPGLSRLIATNLHNRAMPLLRYDTGDYVQGDWRECSCDRTSKVVNKIHGRQDEYLLALDSVRIPTVNLYTFFADRSMVKRFQLIQTAPGALDVNIEFWNDDFDAVDECAVIKNRLESISRLHVTVKQNSEWVQVGEGKFPTLVQMCK